MAERASPHPFIASNTKPSAPPPPKKVTMSSRATLGQANVSSKASAGRDRQSRFPQHGRKANLVKCHRHGGVFDAPVTIVGGSSLHRATGRKLTSYCSSQAKEGSQELLQVIEKIPAAAPASGLTLESRSVRTLATTEQSAAVFPTHAEADGLHVVRTSTANDGVSFGTECRRRTCPPRRINRQSRSARRNRRRPTTATAARRPVRKCCASCSAQHGHREALVPGEVGVGATASRRREGRSTVAIVARMMAGGEAASVSDGAPVVPPRWVRCDGGYRFSSRAKSMMPLARGCRRR